MLAVIKKLAANNISIEYTYSCLPLYKDKVIIIIRVDEYKKAIEVLKDSDHGRLLNIEDLI